jgi:hypothetical protein
VELNSLFLFIVLLKTDIKPSAMKNITLFLLTTAILLLSSCKKNDQSETFKLLTGPIWRSDSLLVDGADAGGPGKLLQKFSGDAKFNTDGSGYFGSYTGKWRFETNDESQIIITADSLLIPLRTQIRELTKSSLKITTTFPNLLNPATPYNIRMTFKPK